MEYAKQEGLRQGREEEMKQGIEQGEQKKKIEIIKEMLKLGINKEIICKITRIKEGELIKIQKTDI